jgi:hypothetical protein
VSYSWIFQEGTAAVMALSPEDVRYLRHLNWPGAPCKLKAAASGLPKPLYSVRDDPRCGVIPNVCGVLTRLEFTHGEKPFLRERSRRA